jgi:hypothetical protein
MNVTKDFMLETMGRAEALVHIRARARAAAAAPGGAPAAAAAAAAVPEADYLVSSARTFEVTDLFGTFMGARARSVYVTVLSGYMYGALWAYSTVFAASFSANVPVFFLNGGNTCNIEEEGTACLGPFFVWLSVFAVLAVPLSCLELKEQVSVQVVMFAARLVVVFLMTGTALGGYGCDGGVVFADMGTDHRPDTPLFTFAGLSTVMPVSIYAFIFHHSVPILSEPIADKRALPAVFRAAFIIVGTAYATLGLVLAVWFGDHVDNQCNLNWRQYVGCVHPHADGAPVTLADRSTGASIVSFIILIFPALDVLSAYPLNAITLGNNLQSAIHPVTTAVAGSGAGPDGAGDDDPVVPAPAGGLTWADWLRSFGTMTAAARRRVFYRLAAAVPPILAGALSTLFGVDLTQILSFTGLIGVAIAFGIPSVLRLWSFARHRAILRSVAEGLGEEVAAAAAAGKPASGVDVDGVVDAAVAAPLTAKAAVATGAGDAALAATPYTTVALKLGRVDKCLFVFAIGIAIFVLVGLILTNGTG